MGNITTVFCWTGGVILPAIHDITVRLLQGHNDQKVDYWLRRTIRELAEDLYVGELDGLSFCRRVIETTGATIPVDDLEAAILRAASLQSNALEVLAEISPVYQIWLISDYPPDWFMQLSGQLTPYPFISTDRLIFTSDFGLPQLVPQIFSQLVHKVDQTMEKCLLIDGEPSRAVDAVKSGLTAEIFIDSYRLRRAFGLRKMLSASG